MMKKKFEYTWEQSVLWLKSQTDHADLVKACYYDDPIEESAKRYHSSSEWSAVRVLAHKYQGKALDVGSGRGLSAFALAKDGWETYAIEPNPSAIVGTAAIETLCQKTGVKIEIIREWGETLKFPDETFNLVHARQVLHHANDLEKFCSELYRVLKPGGLLLATREHVVDSAQDLELFLDGHPLHKLYGGEHAYSLKEYKRALLKAGFKIRSCLSPLESPINYDPQTMDDIKKQIWRKLFKNILTDKASPLLPEKLLSMLSKFYMSSPGRLYTFVATK